MISYHFSLIFYLKIIIKTIDGESGPDSECILLKARPGVVGRSEVRSVISVHGELNHSLAGFCSRVALVTGHHTKLKVYKL